MLNNQNDQFLNDVLIRNYYLDFQQQKTNKEIDFLFSNICPHNCPQCYLSTEKTLYPDYEEKITSSIFSSYAVLLDWYIENNFICNINLKNCNQNIEEILKITYDKFKNNKNNIKIIAHVNPKTIVSLNRDWFNLFTNIHINFILNIYTNGAFCDENLYSDTEYASIINLVQNNQAIVTAYITSKNVEKWIPNYKWWIQQLKDKCFNSVIIKELKDDTWNKMLINKYISFLDFQTDLFNSLFQDKDELFNLLFTNNQLTFSTIKIIDQGILTNEKQYGSCDFHSHLTIDVNTLRLLLCTKINYEDFTLGYFDLNTKKFKSHNPELAIVKTHLKRSSTPHCEKCPLIGICDGFCYGQSYNKIFNPLIPLKENCEFNYSKYNFLIYKYTLLSYLDSPKLKDYTNKTFYNYLMRLKNQIQSNLEE